MEWQAIDLWTTTGRRGVFGGKASRPIPEKLRWLLKLF
jgi:hypothetical protein